MKRFSDIIIAGLLSVTILLTGTSNANAAGFSDLTGYGWAKDYIEDMAVKGVFAGYPDGTFKPGNPVTRIESLIMISNLSSKEEVQKTYEQNKSTFNPRLASFDVDSWARPAVTFSAIKGIIPNTDSMLRVLVNEKSKRPINAFRYEVAVFMVRGLGMEDEINKDAKLNFKDNDQIVKDAVPFIDLLIRKGVLSKDGDGKGYFNPNKEITRAEMATILSRAYQYAPKNKTATPNKPSSPSPQSFTIKGKVNLITYDNDNIILSLIKEDGGTSNFTNRKEKVLVYKDDTPANFSALAVGQDIKLLFENGLMTKIYVPEKETRISGKLESFSTVNKTMTIKTEDGKSTKYTYKDDVKVMINNDMKSVDHLTKDSDIDIYLVGNRVTKIVAEVSKYDIRGEIMQNDYSGITIKKDSGEKITLPLSLDAKIYRNGSRIDDKNSIAPTDTGLFTIENGKIIRIDIDSNEGEFPFSKLEGIEITKDYTQIKFTDRDGDFRTARVNQYTIVRIKNTRVKLDEIKIGYEIDVYTDGGVAVEINSKGEYMKDTLVGRVQEVDLVSRYVTVETSDGKAIDAKYNMETTIEDLDGKILNARDIYDGDRITIIGVIRGGNMEATRMIVDIRP